MIVLVYAEEVISTTLHLNICRRKPLKFMPTILFCLDHALFTSKGVNNGELLQDSETNQIA